MMGVVRFVARACLGAIFVNSGIDLFRNPEGRAKRAAEELPIIPETPLLGKVHGATMAGAGAALVVGVAPALSAGVLAATMVPNTYIGHQFWKGEDPGQRRQQLIHFLKNVAIIGGLLAVIADASGRKRA